MMKPRLQKLLIVSAALLAGLYLLSTWYTREERLVPASFKLLNDAQTVWYAAPILDYTIVVDVIRPGETRQNRVRVVNGEIIDATVRYRKSSGIGWEEARALGPDQAYPFTIPGLYDMIRLPLRSGGRTLIRVDMQGEPPYPHEIVFEPVWENGVRVIETEARVVVRSLSIGEDPP